MGLVHLGRSLEQSGVEVENVTWVSLTSRRSSEQKRHLSVSNGLLGKIVVDDQGVSSVVSEPLSHSTCRERSDVLKRSGLRCGGGNNDRVFHGIVFFQGLDELSNGRSLLSDSDVNTVKLLRLVSGAVVDGLLVQDGVESDSGLSGLSVSNDELSLSTPDRNHGIDGLESSLHRLVDGSSRKNTWSLKLGSSSLGALDWALSVNWETESVDNSSEKTWTGWNVDNLSSSLDSLSLLDQSIVTEKHNSDNAAYC